MPGSPDTYMSYDVPWANVSTTPFRRYKRWVHEGGIATPCIIRWPATIKQPDLTHTPTQIIDITATLIDAAGASYPAEYDGHAIPPSKVRASSPSSQAASGRAKSLCIGSTKAMPPSASVRGTGLRNQRPRRLGTLQHGRGSHQTQRPSGTGKSASLRNGKALPRMGRSRRCPALGPSAPARGDSPACTGTAPSTCEDSTATWSSWDEGTHPTARPLPSCKSPRAPCRFSRASWVISAPPRSIHSATKASK